MEAAENSTATSVIDPTGTDRRGASTDSVVAATVLRRGWTDLLRAATRPLSSMTKLSFTRTESAGAVTHLSRTFRERGAKASHRAPRISQRAVGLFRPGWNTDKIRMGAGSFLTADER